MELVEFLMQKQEKDLKLITKMKWSAIDMLSIDEAIAHAREKAKEIRENIIDGDSLEPYESYCNAMVAKSAEEYEQLAEWLTQLKEYQQLEEQGRLIKLPCKVGDTLYKIIVDKYTKCSLHDKEFSLNCEYCEEKCDSKAIYVIKDFIVFDINEIIFYMKSIGKTVFLTKSEAEARLKELRG